MPRDEFLQSMGGYDGAVQIADQPNAREWWESRKRRARAPVCDPTKSGPDEQCGDIGPDYKPRSDEEIQATPQPRDRYELEEILRFMTPEERSKYEQWIDQQQGQAPNPENSTDVEFNLLIGPARERWIKQHQGFEGS